MRTEIRKKAITLAAAGALALTGINPLAVSASYVGTERENWAAFADVYGEMWDEEMAASQENGASSAELKLEFGDLARTMAGSILTTSDGTPMDLSWLESIALRLAAAKEDNIVDAAIGLCLNDTVLATLELPIDFGNDTVKFRVPEISENYLGVPFEFETEETRQQWQRLKEV